MFVPCSQITTVATPRKECEGNCASSLPTESLCPHTQGRRSITLQLVDRGKAAGQGEDQRLDGPGDVQTVAGRPIRVSRNGADALKQFRARKEAVGPEVPGDWDHSPFGNVAVLFERSADIHLVDDYVLEHGQRRQAGQMRASEDHV